ncbi:MAG: AAA family ATPase [bacterium]
MKKKLPVGISDFEKLISNNYYFVDKSLFIKEVLDSGAAATLIPRPRRFGKTLNLSMLKYFFEKQEKTKKHLFDNLAISKELACMDEQGKYPVIFLTFKDIKDMNWDECYESMTKIIGKEFSRHKYLLESSVLQAFEKKEFTQIMDSTANISSYKRALQLLSFYLNGYHKQKTIILIDEYDVPIHSGFINKYYDQVTNFMRIFLSGGLKDNSDLKFSVLTGILRVSKESIFSGLNNLKVCALLNDLYSDKFGLLENDVQTLVAYYQLNSNFEQIKEWYNGYAIGNNTIYNPWSIINFADNKGAFQPYWINTSDNLIIQELIKNGSDELKEDMELILSDKKVSKPVYENIAFQNIFRNTDVLWSFLLFSGYLTFENKELRDAKTHVDLKIPNVEVKDFFNTVILDWFSCIGERRYNEILESLVTGNIKTFSITFKDFVVKSFSYFDVSGNEPEKFYHAFVLGILVSLNKTHQIKSNRESGYGRYDVMIIPNDKNKPGVIIEFKKVYKDENETMEQAAKQALRQIEEKKYWQELNDMGIKNVVKLAIVFDGKSVLIKSDIN